MRVNEIRDMILYCGPVKADIPMPCINMLIASSEPTCHRALVQKALAISGPLVAKTVGCWSSLVDAKGPISGTIGHLHVTAKETPEDTLQTVCSLQMKHLLLLLLLLARPSRVLVTRSKNSQMSL